NSFTKLQDSPGYIAFAKVINSRPSLGYMVFGTVSYPKDANAESIKSKIYTDLKAGKTFQEVAKLYGANEHEKDNGGVVMGSPTLPDEVYELFKGKKSGYYTPEPLLFGENYFVFNIYNVEPYVLTDKNREFFLRDMNSSLYSENLQDKMLSYLKSDPTYKEFPAFQNMKKSYQAFDSAKDDAVLYQYKKEKTTVGDLKKLIGDKKSEAEKLTPALWSEAISGVNAQDLMRFYSEDFTNQKDIKKQLTEFRKGLYSDYIFSKYLNEEIAKHPEWLTDYYNRNKSKYMWGNRAEGRVAIIADDRLTKEIEKDIKNPKNWETLKAKYYGQLNDKKQILVNFEKGEMSEDADVFTKYKVPFKTGVHQTKMEARTLVIAIDSILPPTQMTQAEAAELLKDAVNEERLRAIIEEQKAKTKIVIQPEFRKDLEKNFKK
ncbi:MAG: peptidylprolyl isomerase, partial [Kaistella sp.]